MHKLWSQNSFLKVHFYFILVRQLLTIEVYHEASPPQLIGTVEASIGEIFGARQKGLTR